MESQIIISEITELYHKPSIDELLHRWIKVEIYKKMREPKASLYVGDRTQKNKFTMIETGKEQLRKK